MKKNMERNAVESSNYEQLARELAKRIMRSPVTQHETFETDITNAIANVIRSAVEAERSAILGSVIKMQLEVSADDWDDGYRAAVNSMKNNIIARGVK